MTATGQSSTASRPRMFQSCRVDFPICHSALVAALALYYLVRHRDTCRASVSMLLVRSSHERASTSVFHADVFSAATFSLSVIPRHDACLDGTVPKRRSLDGSASALPIAGHGHDVRRWLRTCGLVYDSAAHEHSRWNHLAVYSTPHRSAVPLLMPVSVSIDLAVSIRHANRYTQA